MFKWLFGIQRKDLAALLTAQREELIAVSNRIEVLKVRLAEKKRVRVTVVAEATNGALVILRVVKYAVRQDDGTLLVTLLLRDMVETYLQRRNEE